MGDRLNGKVAVVTGGASGIGAATVRRFTAEGATAVIADLQADRAQALLDDLGDAVRFIPCDVTDEDAVAASVALAVDTWGRLDVMFNNAGIVGAVGSIADTSGDDWRRTIDIMVNGVFYGCKHAAKRMVPAGSGAIINTASIAGVQGGLGPHAYTAAKTAVVGLTKSVAAEVMSTGVRCNAIAPGAIPTPLTAHVTGRDPDDLDAVRQDQLDRYGVAPEADDIASAALYLASDEGRFVNGHTLVLDAGRSINGGSPRFQQTPTAMIGIPGRD